MTNCFAKNDKAGMIVIPIGIYCDFGLELFLKVAKFQCIKRKASINAILYVMILPLTLSLIVAGVGESYKIFTLRSTFHNCVPRNLSSF